MTRNQKAYLIVLAKKGCWTPITMANLVDCSVSTARQYANIFGPKKKKPKRGKHGKGE